jgi:Mn-dependent DtxR family transcriptional regulator
MFYSSKPNYIFSNISSMKAKATLKQIAKELNVSVSTVSKALNDSPD